MSGIVTIITDRDVRYQVRRVGPQIYLDHSPIECYPRRVQDAARSALSTAERAVR